MSEVVVFTSSDLHEDIVRSYDLGANAYMGKPVDLDGLEKLVRALEGYWLSLVAFPPPR